MYSYHAFQLFIKSELHFPELLISPDSNSGEEQIHIKLGEVTSTGLVNPRGNHLFSQATETELWLNIPSVARFLISNGNQILIDPAPGVDESNLRVYILGSCMGALLMQRNLFLLHGNAIKVGNYCISFIGRSGAGKSTLCGAFFQRGYSILADDVCAINQQGQVLPSFPQIKLWRDSARYLNIETTNLRRIRPQIEKFAIPLEQQFYCKSLPLNIVYVLNTHKNNEFDLQPTQGLQKLRFLHQNSYRRHYLKGLAKEKNNFLQAGTVANNIAVVKVTRPEMGFELDKLVTMIENDFLSRHVTKSAYHIFS